MNYLVEINAFYDLQLVNRLSPGQISLWSALMSMDNKCMWAPWFTAPNSSLQVMTGLSRDGVYKARAVLQSKGYIQVKEGHMEQAAHYKMISLAKVQVADGALAAGKKPALRPVLSRIEEEPLAR